MPLPKQQGWIVLCSKHKTSDTRGRMAVCITTRFKNAVLNNADKHSLRGTDHAFPATNHEGSSDIKFFKHCYPIIRAMAPELVDKAEKEAGGSKLPSNFVRQLAMARHVMDDNPEGCSRLGSSSNMARRHYVGLDVQVEASLVDSERVIGEMGGSGSDSEANDTLQKSTFTFLLLCVRLGNISRSSFFTTKL